MVTYDQPEKVAARQIAIRTAVELLTQSSYQTAAVRGSYVSEVKEYHCASDIDGMICRVLTLDQKSLQIYKF